MVLVKIYLILTSTQPHQRETYESECLIMIKLRNYKILLEMLGWAKYSIQKVARDILHVKTSAAQQFFKAKQLILSNKQTKHLMN